MIGLSIHSIPSSATETEKLCFPDSCAPRVLVYKLGSAKWMCGSEARANYFLGQVKVIHVPLWPTNQSKYAFLIWKEHAIVCNYEEV